MENWKATREETPSEIALSSKKGAKDSLQTAIDNHEIAFPEYHPPPSETDLPPKNGPKDSLEIAVDNKQIAPPEHLKDESAENGDPEIAPDSGKSSLAENDRYHFSISEPQQKRRSSDTPRRVSIVANDDLDQLHQKRYSVVGGGSFGRGSRSSVISRPSVAEDPRLRRLSIAQNPEEDSTEQDAALRKIKETAHTLLEKECVADDVIRVWECISKFITFKMMEGKGVRIAGLGTFTFRIRKMPVNQKKVKVTKTPVFILSEYVSQMYRLKQEKGMTSNVPEVPLNLSVIANDTRISRSLIEGILTELLQAFARGIVCNKSLEFPFPFIGKLQIRDQKVSMRFYDEFCKNLGFHVAETSPDKLILDDMIPGRMTPLRYHIPSDTYRSVFHLRDLRSVHELPLRVPLVQVDGKLFPETLVEGIGGDKENPKRKTKAVVSLNQLRMHSLDTPIEPLVGKKMVVTTKPLYEPQKTGDCILDLMTACPEIMSRCLRAHLYKQMIDTLGSRRVKARFHRRGNKGPPAREFSFENLQLNRNFESDIDLSPKLVETELEGIEKGIVESKTEIAGIEPEIVGTEEEIEGIEPEIEGIEPEIVGIETESELKPDNVD